MRKKMRFICCAAALCFLFGFIGCDSQKSGETEVKEGEPHVSTPVVLVPSADGTDTIGEERITIDISNKSQGYIMACYHGESENVNIQITGPDEVVYMYFITKPEEYIGIPLSSGSGTYVIEVYEHLENEMYDSVLCEEIDADIENEFLPFLYANQFVNFDENTEAVALGQELTKDCDTTLDALAAVYNYVIENLTYDYEEAENVDAMYLPDVDEVLETKTGICFDYAALMCTMLRTQQIPTKLQIGYTSGVYHAWISTHIKGIGWLDGVIQFDGQNWKLMDPTFASTEDSSEEIMEHINDEENYEIMYER